MILASGLQRVVLRQSSDDEFLSYYPFLIKDHLSGGGGGPDCNPDEGFQCPRPTFFSRDLSGQDCYSDEGFAKAHLPFDFRKDHLLTVAGIIS